MRKFDILANTETREDLARIFGTSVPTVQRWVSDSSKIPKYVGIIIEHLEKIKELKNIAYEYSGQMRDIENSIANYKDAQSELFSYLKL